MFPENDRITPASRFQKRMLDLSIAIPSVVIFAPLCLLIAIIIKLESKGPAVYKSIRVGKHGREFVCYKFRSMVENADELREALRSENLRQGPTFKIAKDPRVTRFGQFIRRYSLDEIPQLFNVIRGEMSIVGPRPHPLDDAQRYEPGHLERYVVKPGLTCLWQIFARTNPSFDVNMQMDLEYIQTWSLLLDLQIIFRTIPVIFRGEGQ